MEKMKPEMDHLMSVIAELVANMQVMDRKLWLYRVLFRATNTETKRAMIASVWPRVDDSKKKKKEKDAATKKKTTNVSKKVSKKAKTNATKKVTKMGKTQ